MLNCCTEKVCYIPLRWLSLGIAILEVLFYGFTSGILMKKNILEFNELNWKYIRSNKVQIVLFLLHVECALSGVVLAIGCVKKHYKSVSFHVWIVGLASILLPYWWIKALLNLKHHQIGFLENCLTRTNGYLLLGSLYCLLIIFWFPTFLYKRQLKQDLFAVVLRERMGKERSTSWKYLKRISQKFRSIDRRKSHNENKVPSLELV